MTLDIIVGAQWGDEGKGRITDLIAAEADIVARFSGGDNAGHTVTIGQDIFKLHLIPSGVIHPEVVGVIGNGVVVNPATLIRELDDLAARGVELEPDRLRLSNHAHLITPAHVALDQAQESRRGLEAIGTTQRGIGPAYVDKAARTGLRAGLLAEPEALAETLQEHVAEKNEWLSRIYGCEALDPPAVVAAFAGYAQRLAPYLADTGRYLAAALASGRRVLAEGAQGTLLDLDHGTYPFVTSSSPTAGGALTGLGLGPGMVSRVVGVAKAFTSRVGSGPFPTEVTGDLALRLRGTGTNPWDEYGTTTGRSRRVGWLDLVMLRYARRVNGLTELALTKLDILSGLPRLRVAVAYELDRSRLDDFPADGATLARCRPVYQELAGWEASIVGVRRWADLPAAARDYVSVVSETVGLPIPYVSVGPERDQVIRVA